MASPDEAAAVPRVNDRAAARRHLRRQLVRDRWRRYLSAGLAVALCTLLVNAIVGDNGYLAAVRLRAEEAELAAAVAGLRRENHRLQADAQRLRTDPAALEETARAELGLLRPGETLVVIRDAAPADTAGTGR
ncbi:MAG: septum formation initiator family protein [Acidobacteria bacterium]|nr:septum formation initiator family protein [Acidobacteriota bacterium]